MRIRMILPIVRTGTPSFANKEYLDRVRGLSGICPETQLDRVGIEHGPASIESRYDEALAGPDILKRVIEAEADGVDAVVVNCFGDPSVRTGRELVSIPVAGPCESSMLVAASLCDRFSVISVVKNIIPLIRENAEIYGVSSKLASVRVTGIPVLELQKDPDATFHALAEEGRKAIELDGADVLILGCTGMTGMAERVSKELGVFVVDPLPTAIKFAETLVSLRLSHSKLAYPAPPEKARTQ
ncbi:aspartate/glutamate racemase family protein [Candidatus Bathyarchaeota archaeon]|nr:aspartate/glutamate racemase family protein [Candidatus Bathyarchaeota archaeon]